jgi:CRISPR/Cas system-associated protein Cas5 (RAMP superfamily)
MENQEKWHSENNEKHNDSSELRNEESRKSLELADNKKNNEIHERILNIQKLEQEENKTDVPTDGDFSKEINEAYEEGDAINKKETETSQKEIKNAEKLLTEISQKLGMNSNTLDAQMQRFEAMESFQHSS